MCTSEGCPLRALLFRDSEGGERDRICDHIGWVVRSKTGRWQLFRTRYISTLLCHQCASLIFVFFQYLNKQIYGIITTRSECTVACAWHMLQLTHRE